jgi:hypothetical protein
MHGASRATSQTSLPGGRGTPLPEIRKRAHLIGPPSIAEFHATVARHRKAALRGGHAIGQSLQACLARKHEASQV